MPIRPENKSRYPADWPVITAGIRRRADNRCEECGVENHALGGRLASGVFCKAQPNGERNARLDWPCPGDDGWCRSPGGETHRLRIIRIVLTIAHLDHEPENCDPANLKALCQRCHNRLDARARRQGIEARQRQVSAVGDLFAGAA